MPSKAELFEAIRSDARRHELSIRALAELHGVHRRTVRAALSSAKPTPRKTRVAQAPKMEPLKPFIDAMLVTDLGAPRKQKHTARRIWTRLPSARLPFELLEGSSRSARRYSGTGTRRPSNSTASTWS